MCTNQLTILRHTLDHFFFCNTRVGMTQNYERMQKLVQLQNETKIPHFTNKRNTGKYCVLVLAKRPFPDYGNLKLSKNRTTHKETKFCFLTLTWFECKRAAAAHHISFLSHHQQLFPLTPHEWNEYHHHRGFLHFPPHFVHRLISV